MYVHALMLPQKRNTIFTITMADIFLVKKEVAEGSPEYATGCTVVQRKGKQLICIHAAYMVYINVVTESYKLVSSE